MNDDDRSPPSALRGRLADVYVPALATGSLEALSRRLGNRATIDDPLYGRASSLGSIDPLLGRVATFLSDGGATYEHLSSTTGVDRDVAEGRLTMKVAGEARTIPIAIVAERRRLREIELRAYYLPVGAAPERKSRAPLLPAKGNVPLADLIESSVKALRAGTVDPALANFEETSNIVDPTGRMHARQGGAMATFLGDLGAFDINVGGVADDGRTACVEVTMLRRDQRPAPALFAFERGLSGLVRELRFYWE